MIFASEINNTPVVIFSYWKNPDKTIDLATYKKTYLPYSALSLVNSSKKDKFGTETKHDAKIIFTNIEDYIPFNVFSELSYEEMLNSPYWTLNIGTPNVFHQSYILLGNEETVNFVFASGTTESVEIQAKDMRKEYQHNNYRPKLIKERLNFIPPKNRSFDLRHISADLIVTAKQ